MLWAGPWPSRFLRGRIDGGGSGSYIPDAMIAEMNLRSREILRQIVETYLETGGAVGSRTLSRRLDLALSPASIRNVMSDLEGLGLLYAPHPSAGRLPTEAGLRLFVDGLLEIGDLNTEDRQEIEARCVALGRDSRQVFEEASQMLSGLSSCAGLVVAPTQDDMLRHIEFVPIGTDRALAVLVGENGLVENRILDLPPGVPASSLVEAGNYLNAKLTRRTLLEARAEVESDIQEHRMALDDLTGKVVEAGLATWSEAAGRDGVLVVRGQVNLLDDVMAVADLERIRGLFEALERKETLLHLISMTENAEGVQIFIGSENELFGLSGCSMIISPYKNMQAEIVGAIGVIGPTRMNYARIIPMVDYTAKLVGQLID